MLLKRISFRFIVTATLAITALQSAQAESVTIVAATVEVAPSGSVEVPVRVRAGQGLGSLQFILHYDAALLEPASPAVKSGAVSGGAMIESFEFEPGSIRVGMISGEPVTGDGELLLVQFQVLGLAGQSSKLTLDDVRAWDHENNLEMLVTAEPGQLTISSNRLSLTMIIGAIAAAAIVLVVLVMLGATGRKKSASTA